MLRLNRSNTEDKQCSSMNETHTEFFIDINKNEKEVEFLNDFDNNSNSTEMTSRNEMMGSVESIEEEQEECDFVIHMPERAFYNRIPGNYDDLQSFYKKKHNNLIYKYSSLVKEKITALILDGKKMRTAKALLKNSEKLNKIHIVEINSQTFEIMKRRLRKSEWNVETINIYNAHIMDYVLRGVDPKINVVYLDVMCNYFDSHRTQGTQSIIEALFKQLTRPRTLFAATFCLRHNIFNYTYKQEVKEIYSNLTLLFNQYDYDYTFLIKKKEMR